MSESEEQRLRELADELNLEVRGPKESQFTLIDRKHPRQMSGTADGLLKWLAYIHAGERSS